GVGVVRLVEPAGEDIHLRIPPPHVRVGRPDKRRASHNTANFVVKRKPGATGGAAAFGDAEAHAHAVDVGARGAMVLPAPEIAARGSFRPRAARPPYRTPRRRGTAARRRT